MPPPMSQGNQQPGGFEPLPESDEEKQPISSQPPPTWGNDKPASRTFDPLPPASRGGGGGRGGGDRGGRGGGSGGRGGRGGRGGKGGGSKEPPKNMNGNIEIKQFSFKIGADGKWGT